MSKIILVTGASTGIGAATAELMAADNTIIIHYNSSKKAAIDVAKEVEENGGTAHLVQADLTTEAGCTVLFDNVSKNFDRLDVLVNNAGGMYQRHPIVDGFEWQFMEKVFGLNVFSVMKLTELSVPLLKKGTDPNIINITSVALRHGAPTATIYGAAKGAIDSFTRGIAKELAPDIRVNAVAPGVIETPFHEKISTPEQMETFKGRTPVGRNGQAIHVALSIKHLAENDFITGETIDVNGGIFMR